MKTVTEKEYKKWSHSFIGKLHVRYEDGIGERALCGEGSTYLFYWFDRALDPDDPALCPRCLNHPDFPLMLLAQDQ